MPRNLGPVLCAALVAFAFACDRDLATPEVPEDPDEPVADRASEPGASSSEAAARPEACAERTPDDCASMAIGLLVSEQAQDAVAPLDWACAEGVADACAGLATGYRIGRLAPPEAGVVFALDERGCAAGSDESCRMLGVAYYEGVEVTQDLAKAQELFASGCAHGEAPSCQALGLVAFEGKAGGQDLPAAIAAFERACALDLAESCFNLGVIYADNSAGAADLGAATTWMSRACELGDQDGCKVAGQLAEAANPSPVAQANVRMGSIEVDGMTIKDLECRIAGGGGLFGTLALLATMSERKKAFDKCAPKGAEPVVHWRFVGSKTEVVSVDASSDAIAACIEKAMAKVPATMDAECQATLVVGAK